VLTMPTAGNGSRVRKRAATKQETKTRKPRQTKQRVVPTKVIMIFRSFLKHQQEDAAW
jgi:hypothetical protein